MAAAFSKVPQQEAARNATESPKCNYLLCDLTSWRVNSTPWKRWSAEDGMTQAADELFAVHSTWKETEAAAVGSGDDKSWKADLLFDRL